MTDIKLGESCENEKNRVLINIDDDYTQRCFVGLWKQQKLSRNGEHIGWQ